MTKELQKKFIRSAMLAVTLLLVIFFSVINISNYYVSERQIRQTLQRILLENAQMKPEEMPGAQDDVREPERAPEPKEDARAKPPGDLRSEDELLAGQSYCYIRFGADGRVISLDVSHAISLTEESAKELADSAASSGRTSGRTDGYAYLISPDRVGGGSEAALLDLRGAGGTAVRILIISAAAGILCWLLMLALIVWLSGKAIRPIAENIERQKRFVTDAGHEIKTPLSIIRANADALELHEGGSRWLDNIRSQVDRLSSLTQNMLTLSRMDEGRDSREAAELFDAGKVFREICGSFREAAEARQVDLREKAAEGTEIRFRREEFERLVNIFMENAVKYAKTGGFIEAELESIGAGVRLTVRNSCDALPEGEPDRLFDRFYRDDRSRTRATGGSGIGLSVARAIVLQAGGSIRADCEEGDVIRFTADIPAL